MPNYSYKYFSGANCTIRVNGKRLAETAGISYSVLDSATPVYGYNSRFFDAVAPGQKIVQGSFVVNYTKPNYVFDKIKSGHRAQLRKSTQNTKPEKKMSTKQGKTLEKRKEELQRLLKARDVEAAFAYADFFLDPANPDPDDINYEIFAALEPNLQMQAAAPIAENSGFAQGRALLKDPTLAGPFKIVIDFMGKPYLTIIHSAYIIGHASAIQIDENVILEEYNFIARTLTQEIKQ